MVIAATVPLLSPPYCISCINSKSSTKILPDIIYFVWISRIPSYFYYFSVEIHYRNIGKNTKNARLYRYLSSCASLARSASHKNNNKLSSHHFQKQSIASEEKPKRGLRLRKLMRIHLGWAAAGAALLYISRYVTRTQSHRAWIIKARVPASPDKVFQLHLDPVSFYRVLTFMPKGPVYRVLRVDRDAASASMAYDLEHETSFKVINSRPQRLNINEKARKFDETFTALSTTFYFEWAFDQAFTAAPEPVVGAGAETETDILLTVTLTGPLLGVWFFSVAGGGPEKIWTRRFETTNRHLQELLESSSGGSSR